MIGLALSGGGFRATLFHVGSIMRINELGLLRGINEITSVSGGSILSAYLGLKWNALEFNDQNVAANYDSVIVEPVRKFCSRTIDVGTILGGIINPFRRPSELLINKYRKHLFGNATLQDLPGTEGTPKFTIYSTSMQSGASVRFTRGYLGEYHLGIIKSPKIPLAVAVAASSAFPPPLCPVKLKVDPGAWIKSDIADYFDDEYLKSTMWLVDGGVYDNLGLTRLVRMCDTIFVSDAGAPFSPDRKMLASRWSQIMRTKRTLDIMSEQVRALRMVSLIADYADKVKKGAYWGIGTNIDEYPLAKNNLSPALATYNATTQAIARIRTRLNKFNEDEQGKLINWGYCLTDAALRSYFDGSLPAAEKLPCKQSLS
ncbi:MAG: patatin-like phospholipase family protein [Candidatus Zixiibacteriota bacterium]